MLKNMTQQRPVRIVCAAAMVAWMMSPVLVSAQAGPPGRLPPLPSPNKILGWATLPQFPAEAPKPSPDPRNFQGGWRGDRLIGKLGGDMFNERLPLNAAGQRVIDRRVKAQESGVPYSKQSTWCRPVGFTWMLMADPFLIGQNDKWLEINSYHQHGRIFIYLDPKLVPKERQHAGVSTGHWDGNTLVVETSNFKMRTWLDTEYGTPASPDAKITTRLRKVTAGDRTYIEAVHTVDDSKYYTRPFSWVMAYYWRPDQTYIAEYNCEEQVGDKSGGYNSALAIEPAEDP